MTHTRKKWKGIKRAAPHQGESIDDSHTALLRRRQTYRDEVQRIRTELEHDIWEFFGGGFLVGRIGLFLFTMISWLVKCNLNNISLRLLEYIRGGGKVEPVWEMAFIHINSFFETKVTPVFPAPSAV